MAGVSLVSFWVHWPVYPEQVEGCPRERLGEGFPFAWRAKFSLAAARYQVVVTTALGAHEGA